MAQRIFLLIDGHALIYRSYFAFPKQLTDPNGRIINAVYGFTRSVLKAIREYDPEYTAVAFDHKGPSFRKEEYDLYKANRPEMPEQLQPQIPIIRDVVQALNIPQFEIEGYEADDIIGTISKKLDKISKQKLLTIIVSGDQDLFQLVDDNTHVWLPGRGSRSKDKEYDAQAVKKKMGLPPGKIIDMKALMGDSSDNIPGIRGIGPKTAVRILQYFKSVEQLYHCLDSENIDYEKCKKKKISKRIINKLKVNKDVALMSQSLATINVTVPLDFDLESCRVSGYDKKQAVDIFEQLQFKSLVKLLPDDEFEKSVQDTLF